MFTHIACPNSNRILVLSISYCFLNWNMVLRIQRDKKRPLTSPGLPGFLTKMELEVCKFVYPLQLLSDFQWLVRVWLSSAYRYSLCIVPVLGEWPWYQLFEETREISIKSFPICCRDWLPRSPLETLLSTDGHETLRLSSGHAIHRRMRPCKTW